MGNQADDCGTDVEIHRRPFDNTIYAESRTGASEELLALLDSLGLERKTLTTAGPVYVWHEVPEQLSETQQKQLASRAIPSLLAAGFKVNITADIFDQAAYNEAVNEVKAAHSPASAAPPPGTSPTRS